MRDSKGRFIKGNMIGAEHRFVKGHKLSEETKNKMKGRTVWNKGLGYSSSENIGICAIVPKKNKGYIDAKGYRRFKIDGVTWKEHRLVWTQHFGDIPEGNDIHHIDGNKLNNKIENLEMVEHGRHSRKHGKEFKRTIERANGRQR